MANADQSAIRTLIALALSLYGAASAPEKCIAAEPEAKEWDVAVSVKQDTHRKEWNFEVAAKYLGRGTVEVANTDLPGKWYYATKLYAVRTGGLGELLRQVLPVDDPPLGTTRITHGQITKRVIVLSERFPSLGNDLETSSVVVFWTCKIGKARRIGGWVEIPGRD